jgi:predicted Mrr-cat superfamily restriction endonuclease
MQGWLIRPRPIKKNRISEFLKNGIVAIGWPLLPDLSNKTKEEIREQLLHYYSTEYQPNSTSLGNVITIVESFVHKMKVGDGVLAPDEEDVHIGKITGDYYYDPSKANMDDGYPHQRTVEWLRKISRENLPEELRKSLRAQLTIVNLKDRLKYLDAPPETALETRMTQEKSDLQIDNLMADAIRILQNELNSDDADRRLKAALQIVQLRQDGVIK